MSIEESHSFCRARLVSSGVSLFLLTLLVRTNDSFPSRLGERYTQRCWLLAIGYSCRLWDAGCVCVHLDAMSPLAVFPP